MIFIGFSICMIVFGALIFIAGDTYGFLLLGMFLYTGASTLMNTTINILVPTIFVAAPGLIVNVLFFIQQVLMNNHLATLPYEGADQMSRLRVYRANKLKYQYIEGLNNIFVFNQGKKDAVFEVVKNLQYYEML